MQEDPEDVKVRKQTPTKENVAPVSATALLSLNSSVNLKILITRRFLIRIPFHTIQFIALTNAFVFSGGEEVVGLGAHVQHVAQHNQTEESCAQRQCRQCRKRQAKLAFLVKAAATSDKQEHQEQGAG